MTWPTCPPRHDESVPAEALKREMQHLQGLPAPWRADITPMGSGVLLGRCQLPGAMPRQELVITVDGMIGEVD
jgi:hypothetical protein